MKTRQSALPVLVAVAALALIAVTGLLVFRDTWDDSVAAVVADEEITEEQVDGVVRELRQAREAETEQLLDAFAEDVDEAELAQLREQEYGALEQRLAVDRDRVIEMRVLTEAGSRYASEAGVDVPSPAPALVAEDTGLPPDNAYVQVVAEFLAVMNALERQSEPAAPDEADQREVYDNLVAEGLTQTSFEEWEELLTAEVMGEAVGQRDLLVDVVEQSEVEVNPEYDLEYRVPVPIGDEQSWLGVPLGE